jgi:DNA-binding MarR family transcriptional regulator
VRGISITKVYRDTIYLVMPSRRALSDLDYERLLELRTGLRRFLHWSEEGAEALGMTAMQHQLLLAIRGHGGPTPPSVGDLAGSLLLRPHSTTELVDRAEEAGLVRRSPDPQDHRVVRLRLTPLGSRRLEQLSVRNLEELHRLARRIGPLVADLDADVLDSAGSRA